jgi:oxygen-dependent protoporphyrinogen oxidase
VDRVSQVRLSVAKAGALGVCGAAYDGLGIPACISSAEAAVTQVLDALRDVGE